MDTFTISTSLQPVVSLALATVLVALFLRLRLSPVLGYLATGVLIGPSVLGWLSDGPAMQQLAELGVVLLMFTVGLELSLPRLLAAKRLVLGVGGAQVLSTTLVFGLVAWWWWNLPAIAAALVGAALAMSSTAVVLKQLGEQMELPAPHGRTATGILLFQDIAALGLLAVLPALASDTASLTWPLLLALGKAALIFIALALLGRRALPPLLHWVASTRSLELFMLTALVLALAAAAASAAAGLSATLGAFMAGMLLGETPFRHQIEADIRPFRDLMLGLFLATIGMQLDLQTLVAMPDAVLLVLVAAVVGKVLILAPLLRSLGQPRLEGSRSAVCLAQGGELGLLLVASAYALGLLDGKVTQALLGGLILSMALAPILLRFNAEIAALMGPGRQREAVLDAEAQVAEASSGLDRHVVVCGYGRLGQNLMRLLSEEGIPALALDLDPERVRQAAAAGEPVLFGNALQPGILHAAGIERARALAITMRDPALATRILGHLRSLDGDLPILVRSRAGVHGDPLHSGNTTVFPEGLETALAFAGQLLILLGLPPSQVERRLSAIRAEDYAPLRAFFHDSAEAEAGADAHDYPEQVRAVTLGEGHRAAGCTAQELDLSRYGAELIDARRGALRVPGHLLDTRLRPGDVLLLRGHREALDRATAALVEGSS